MNTSNCQWLIAPTAADSIKITFTNFSTERYFDTWCFNPQFLTKPSFLMNLASKLSKFFNFVNFLSKKN
jgi:hypothetical protein